MKKIIIGILALGLLSPACRTQQSAAVQEVVTSEDDTKIYTAVPTYQPTATVAQPTSSPVRTQSENFTFAQQSDAQNYQGSYFIIIGSFSSIDNANRYKQELIPQGFSPVVLKSESGYYRVCTNSYSEESAARQRVQQIRNQYPKYADTWLLIKK